MSTVAPTPPAVEVDPRIEERIRDVARRRRRRRRRVTISVLVIVVLAIGAWLLLHSSWFSARIVTVRGADAAERTEVLRVTGLAGHPPLLDVDAGTAARTLERLPWVDRAHVARDWPDHVAVTVTVRQPAAQLADGSGWAVVDRTGRVLATSASPVTGLPTVKAPVTPGAPGTWVAAAADPGVLVAAELPVAFKDQVAGVEVEPGGQVELQLTTPITVDLGSTAQLNEKFNDTAALLAGAALADGDVIDVTVPGSPVVSGP